MKVSKTTSIRLLEAQEKQIDKLIKENPYVFPNRTAFVRAAVAEKIRKLK